MQRKVSESPIGTDYRISPKDMEFSNTKIFISVIRVIFWVRDSDNVFRAGEFKSCVLIWCSGRTAVTAWY